MCDAGRIRHHLKHNLWRPESTVLFVGYQSVGTLGRSLVDGADEVKLFGETIHVRATIEKLAGISGHADNNGLLKWVSSFAPKPTHVFVVHGEDEAAETFAARIRDELGLDASAPYNGESWRLYPLQKVAEGNHAKLKKPVRDAAAMEAVPARVAPKPGSAAADRQAASRASESYSQLTLAAHKLLDVVERMQNRGKKEQRKLTSGILALVKKFSRR